MKQIYLNQRNVLTIPFWTAMASMFIYSSNGYMPSLYSRNSELPMFHQQRTLLSIASTTTGTRSDTCLWMAKMNRRNAGGAGGGKKNKNSQFSSPKKKKKQGGGKNEGPKSKKKSNSKNDTFMSAANLAIPKSPSSSSSRSTPPWQVMSKKDQIKNAQTLKEQREQIKNGGAGTSTTTPVPVTTTYSADISTKNTLLTPTMRSLISWKRFKPSPGSMSSSASSSSSSSSSSDLAFVGSYLDNRTPPSLGVPEIAFLGRSNVGKSSLLNKLVSSNIARVGKTPGATASVNLYAMTAPTKKNSETQKPILGLVDLPGFGYAKLSKDLKASVEKAAEKYLNQRLELALGILLVDSRREPSMDDKSILAALYDLGIPLVVVATKLDKLKANEREQFLERINVELGLPDNQPLAISSMTGEGVKDLWRIILDACEDKVAELKGELDTNDEDDDEEDEDDWWDDDGNKKEVFQDDDDFVYDQGYDWVQGNSEVVYEEGEEESSYGRRQNLYGSDEEDDEYDSGISESSKRRMLENQERQAMENEAMKLKNLKKIARQLDRRGEV